MVPWCAEHLKVPTNNYTHKAPSLVRQYTHIAYSVVVTAVPYTVTSLPTSLLIRDVFPVPPIPRDATRAFGYFVVVFQLSRAFGYFVGVAGLVATTTAAVSYGLCFV